MVYVLNNQHVSTKQPGWSSLGFESWRQAAQGDFIHLHGPEGFQQAPMLKPWPPAGPLSMIKIYCKLATASRG